MSKIHVVRKHGLTLRRALTLAEKVADQLAGDYDIDHEWDGNLLHFKRSGLQGQLEVTDETITIEAKLGFLLMAMRSTIQNGIEEKLDEQLAAAAKSAAKPAKAAAKPAAKPAAKAAPKTAAKAAAKRKT